MIAIKLCSHRRACLINRPDCVDRVATPPLALSGGWHLWFWVSVLLWIDYYNAGELQSANQNLFQMSVILVTALKTVPYWRTVQRKQLIAESKFSGASVNFKQRLWPTWGFINCVWWCWNTDQDALSVKMLCPPNTGAVYFTDAVVLAKSQRVGCRASACTTEPFVSPYLSEYHNQLKAPHHQHPQPVDSLEIKSLW